MELKIGFIGTGTLGTALALALTREGHRIVAAASKRGASSRALASRIPGCTAVDSAQEVAAQAQLVFVATPDDVIPQIASQVQWKQGQWVVHCSGADSREVLKPARAMGAHTGVFHPLQSFAGGGDPSSKFQGITFALEGEGALLDTLKGLASNLGGDSIVLPAEDKVLYHTSAVIVSNYLVTLMGMGTELWEKFDQPRNEAVKALLPLIKGTLENIEKVGLPDCLTGPIARGDETTIAKHLHALKERDENMLRAYCELGLQTIPIALAKGRINEAKARKLEALFHSAVKEEVKSYS